MRVHVKLIKPLIARQIQKVLGPHVAHGGGGVVYQNIHTAKCIHSVLDQTLEIRFHRQIGRHRNRPPAGRLNFAQGLAKRAGQVSALLH